MFRTLLSILFFSFYAAGAADVAGKWAVSATGPDGRDYRPFLEFSRRGGSLTGSMIAPHGGPVALQDLRLQDGRLTFRVPFGDAVYQVKFTVSDKSMDGTYTAPDGSSGPVHAVRADNSSRIAGAWKGRAKGNTGQDRDFRLELLDAGGKITGTVTIHEGDLPVENAKLEGDRLTFQLTVDDGTYHIELTVGDNTMKGSYSGPGGETGEISCA